MGLKYDTIGVYVSRDGGYNWKRVRWPIRSDWIIGWFSVMSVSCRCLMVHITMLLQTVVVSSSLFLHWVVVGHSLRYSETSKYSLISNKNFFSFSYSFDWGLCWHWTTFISERFHFTGLLIEPTLASTDAAVWGYTTDDSMWHVNTLDFKSILRRPCETL